MVVSCILYSCVFVLSGLLLFPCICDLCMCIPPLYYMCFLDQKGLIWVTPNSVGLSVEVFSNLMHFNEQRSSLITKTFSNLCTLLVEQLLFYARFFNRNVSLLPTANHTWWALYSLWYVHFTYLSNQFLLYAFLFYFILGLASSFCFCLSTNVEYVSAQLILTPVRVIYNFA